MRRIIHELSAGGLVLRRAHAGYELLLIGRNEPRIWSFPKGHIELNETEEVAALREVREETGCEAAIIAPLMTIAYTFSVNRRRRRKTVTFFLMRYLSGDTADHDHEADEARWFPLESAHTVLRHTNERRLLGLARTHAATLNPDSIGTLPDEPATSDDVDRV